MDRRVRRTRELLWRSLVDLLLERGYDKVSVQDILDRADVGRSTFYAHYQNKDDLLTSRFEDLRADILKAADDDPTDVLGPLRAVFRYSGENRDLFQATVGKHEPAMLVVRRGLTTVVADHLRTRIRTGDFEATIAFVTSGLTGVLTWWLNSDSGLTTEEVFERFRRLAMTGISPLLT
ncbi:AcrR family transcriptional regulator [Kibdelosporangium banguiense]|uniref:AcrR family transcriptional regulator n=1 Tax=Kibdelosporangium banguiense TaxID=1365924 RepID=A0ABS4TPI5_9PSEU|nr:TetR/AcrR family transcriptional regulator [Kibdelosporangium banguiense]MBP2326311.1 AcrR family transcriptional regulator [Kibdelosporangium banguiense]